MTEKRGTVRNLATGATVLDIRSSVVDQGERGLLGLAFDGDGSHLYVSYSDRNDGASIVAEYALVGGTVDVASRRQVIRVEQPFTNHNGGDVHWGPDGMLWLALGDGGSGGDPLEHGQNTDTLLGSILRIDPTRPSAGRQYGIPADNPFASGGGRPELWLYGVRNPWRISFDRTTSDLWVADVGQNAWEEITFLPSPERGRGANLGWNEVEGTHRFDGPAPAGSTPPVYEYPHSQGCSITGGYVYRGEAIPALRGAYLFADLCRSSIRAIRVADGTVVDEHTYAVDAGTPISFGQEADGELLVLSQDGSIRRIVPG